MGSEFTFYDYIDGEGRNVVYEWLGQIPIAVKVKFNNRLLHLEGTKVGQWTRPLVDSLDGHCAGLFEVRSSRAGQQYRILGAHMGSERKPTLMHCFIKKDQKVSEKDCDTAFERMAEVEADPTNRRVEHNYG